MASTMRAVPTRSTVSIRSQVAMVGEMPAAWATMRSVPWSPADPGQAGDGGGVADVGGHRLAPGARAWPAAPATSAAASPSRSASTSTSTRPDHPGGTGGTDATPGPGDDPDPGHRRNPGRHAGRRGTTATGACWRTPRSAGGCRSPGPARRPPAAPRRCTRGPARSCPSRSSGPWSQSALNSVMESPSPPAQSPTVTRVNPTCGCSACHASTSLSSAALLTA